MLSGKVIDRHSEVVGDPHSSDSVTQYWVLLVFGLTVIDCPGSIIVPFAVQV